MAKSAAATLEDFRLSVIEVHLEHTHRGKLRVIKKAEKEALKQLHDEVIELIGRDEYHWNMYPNGVVFDFAMSPEMEANHNKRIDTRNELRAELRTKVDKYFNGDK